MELWFTEKQTPVFGITAKIKQTYVTEKTDFQDLAMVETEEFGNMLLLDGMVMTTVKDEFVYHEMAAHPALNTHPNPKKVLVVGGGDGGVIREVIKHAAVEKAVLVEIDGKVIEYSKNICLKSPASWTSLMLKCLSTTATCILLNIKMNTM